MSPWLVADGGRLCWILRCTLSYHNAIYLLQAEGTFRFPDNLFPVTEEAEEE